MRFLDFLYPAILTLSIHTLETEAARRPGDSVLLSNVKTLTLRKGLKTSHRRVSAVPQLKCVGGNAKGLYEVDVLRCNNQGSDYDAENIQWTCTASLPSEFKLGSTDVICEGYDSSSDPYVLKGSCGVEYRLMLTDLGEKKYGRGSENTWEGFKGNSGIEWQAIVFFAIFLSVIGWMVYAAFFRDHGTRLGAGGNNLGWNGGGGGGGPGGNDPPPPYDPDPKPSSFRQSAAPAPGQQGWRPGFWTGALGGAAAGYMAGNRGQQQRRNQDMPSRGWYNFQDNNDPGEGSSGWGSGGRTRSSGSSGSSFSSTRHESTGFGSTTRR